MDLEEVNEELKKLVNKANEKVKPYIVFEAYCDSDEYKEEDKDDIEVDVFEDETCYLKINGEVYDGLVTEEQVEYDIDAITFGVQKTIEKLRELHIIK